jgi:hypothetical protein
LFAGFGESSAQSDGTIKGYVRDADNGETLIGATVLVRGSSMGTTTNEYGFYSLTVPNGTVELQVSYLGYADLFRTVELAITATVDFELVEEGTLLDEVVVIAEEEDGNVSNIEMSVEQLDVATLRKIPSLLGEVDVIRGIQLLPGVSTVGEGAAGFNVRGGSIDQNLVILDEAPVFNSSHLFGFFSVFNPDAVKNVKLYKGGTPSRFGGRLSSILDVRMREGNNKKFQMDGGIGTIFSRLSIEAPIVKDKSSFLLAARRSYIDILAKPFLNGTLSDTKLSFYDYTLKTNYKFSDKDQIFLSGYLGRDVFGIGSGASFDWGNTTTTLRWNHLFSDKLFTNLTLYYSDYDYAINFGEDREEDGFNWDASIVNLSFKPELAYYANPNNVIRFGGQGIYYRFEPANAVATSGGEVIDISLSKQYAAEYAAFIEHETTLADGKLKLNYGLRVSAFQYLGGSNVFTFDDNVPLGTKRPLIGVEATERGEVIETYFNPEPRLAIQYQLNRASSVKGSYQRTAQYIHLLSNTAASIPLDLWTPSTNNIKPQSADQWAVGYFRNFKDNAYEFSVETYFKKFYDLLDYIDGANLTINQLVEGEVLSGQGRAYGLELSVEKKKGRLGGFLSYTLARSERLIEGINNNEYYPSRFDQTHNFSVTSFYDLNKRITLSANFVYNTGTPLTIQSSGYYQLGYYVPNVDNDTRNGFRIPDYHRLDFSMTLDPKESKQDNRWQGQWIFGVYNVYNRRNPFNIYGGQTDERPVVGQPIRTQANQLSVVGNFIPSVSYNFRFK